jgi:hypothetical protein
VGQANFGDEVNCISMTAGTEFTKDELMRLQEWEVTIQEMIDECRHQQKDASKVLMEWRAKLEKEPSLLQPFQIDEIVREVRQRLC